MSITTHYRIHPGEDIAIPYLVAGEDLSAASLTFTLMNSSGATLASKTVGAGIERDGDNPDRGVITLPSADTSLVPGMYPFSFACVDSGQKAVFSDGTITVKKPGVP